MELLIEGTPTCLYDLADMVQVKLKVDRHTGDFSGKADRTVTWPGVSLEVPLHVLAGRVLAKHCGALLCRSIGDLGLLCVVNGAERAVFMLDLSVFKEPEAILLGITDAQGLADAFKPGIRAGYRRSKDGYARIG